MENPAYFLMVTKKNHSNWVGKSFTNFTTSKERQGSSIVQRLIPCHSHAVLQVESSPSGGLPGLDSTNLRWLWMALWVFPKIGVPQNGWLIMENPIKMGWFWGYHYFRKPPYTIWIIQKKKKGKNMINQIWFILSKGNQSKNSGLTWCWTHVNLPFASMAAHAVRVSRNCFNLSSSRFQFFSIWILQRLSLSFWSYIFPPISCSRFDFPPSADTFSFGFQTKGVWGFPGTAATTCVWCSSIQHPIFHAKNLRGLTYRIIPIPARSCYHQLHQGMSWTIIIQLGACWKTEV